MVLSKVDFRSDWMKSDQLQPGIYYSVDWVTFMCFGVTVFDVLEQLVNKPQDDLQKVFDSSELIKPTYGEQYKFTFQSFSIEIPKMAIDTLYYHGFEGVGYSDFFNLVLPQIRVNISGSQLDNLRVYYDRNCERLIFDIHFDRPGARAHLTRVDHAFDLVDYCPDFYNDLMTACLKYGEDGFVPTGRRCAYMKYSCRSGKERTVYIGSGSNCKLLRVYDKKFQFEQADQYISKCPFGTPDNRPKSWIRIELQARREFANSFHEDYSTPEAMFQFIYETYGVREKGSKQPDDFWNYLFNWQENLQLSKIKTMFKYVEQVMEVPEQLEAWFDRNEFSILRYIAYHGLEYFNSKVVQRFDDLYSVDVSDDPRMAYRRTKLTSFLKECVLMGYPITGVRRSLDRSKYEVVFNVHAILDLLYSMVNRQRLLNNSGHILSMDEFIGLLENQICSYREGKKQEVTRA